MELGDAMEEQPTTVGGIRRAPAYMTDVKALVEDYRTGSPLRIIADRFEGSVVDICDALAIESVPDDELERHRSIRRRSRAATCSIRDNIELITRLDQAAMTPAEIPVVLRALGQDIDVEVAVELLNIAGIQRADRPISQEPVRLSDKLSLLYVVGKHHGIKPDYQLALGHVPSDEAAQLRLLTTEECPPRRFAEVLAVVETTKLAIRARVVTTLSVAEYTATAELLYRSLRGYVSDNDDLWPAPARTLVRRLGDGWWEQALGTVGLTLRTATDRFGDRGFHRALRDYAEECSRFHYPLTLENYDRWVMVQASRCFDRPSAVEMMTHHGGWLEALETVPGLNEHQRIPDPPAEFPDGALFECANAAHEAAWVRAGEYICELLGRMGQNKSLQIQYGDQAAGALGPYAQATRGAVGVWCEIVSEGTLPSHIWPADADYMELQGWLAPDDEVPDWCKESVPIHDAGHQILNGLRFGRLCQDPWQLRWSTRPEFAGPGPDRGVTVEDTLAGEIQTLRNAS